LKQRDFVLIDAFTGFGTPTEEEQKIAKDVEQYIVRKGYRVPRWSRATFIMTLVFLVITILIC